MEDSRALSEHAQHQMLEKKLGEQAKIVPRNLKGPPVAARPPSVLVAKEKGHPKPVAPRRKPVLRPRPPGTPVPRPRSLPARQPGADSNSNLGGVALIHQNSKSRSNSVSTTSNSSHKTESNNCKEIARELKQRHLKPVLEEIANCNFAELERTKETVLKEYDEEASGPDKKEVREELQLDMNTEMPVARFACSDAIGKYRDMLHNIVVEARYDSEEIQRKFAAVDQEVLNEYQSRCKGINPEKIQTNESILRSNMEDKKEHFLLVNSTLSHAFCENLRSNIVARVSTECVQYLADHSVSSLHEQLDIISKLKEIKSKHLSEFDAKAKGPTKLEVRSHCFREMENEVFRIQMAMSGDTLTMAIKMYHTKMKDIADQLPLEENDLTRQHKQAASLVRTLFNDRLRGFDERAISGPKQIMEALTEYPEAQLTNANYHKSLEQCQDLTTEIIKQIRHSTDGPIRKIERGGQLQKFNRLKEDGLKRYDAQAKGPGREAFRLICEEGIDGLLRSRKKYHRL